MCVSTFEYNRLTNELHGLETQQRFLTSLEKYGNSNLDKGAISFLNLGLTNLGLESVICNDVMTSEKGRLLITLENAESEKKNVGAKIKEVLTKLLIILRMGIKKIVDFFSNFFNFFKRNEKDITVAHEVFTMGNTKNIPAEQARKMLNSTGGGSDSKTPDNKTRTSSIPYNEILEAFIVKKGKFVFKTSGTGWAAVILHRRNMTYSEVMDRIHDWEAILQAVEEDYRKLRDNYDADVKNAVDGERIKYRYTNMSYIRSPAELAEDWDISVTDDNFISIDRVKEPKAKTNVEIDFSSVKSLSSEFHRMYKEIGRIKDDIEETEIDMIRKESIDLKISKQLLWVNQQRLELLKFGTKIWLDYERDLYLHAYGPGASSFNKPKVIEEYLLRTEQ